MILYKNVSTLFVNCTKFTLINVYLLVLHTPKWQLMLVLMEGVEEAYEAPCMKLQHITYTQYVVA